MKFSYTTYFNNRLREDPMGISEADIAAARKELDFGWKSFALWRMVAQVLAGFGLILAVALNAGDLRLMAQGVLPNWVVVSMMASAFVLSPILMFSMKLEFLVGSDIEKNLVPMEEATLDECRTMLALCAVNPRAEQVRQQLVGQGRILRRMHFKYMQSLSAPSSQQACKVLHGIAA